MKIVSRLIGIFTLLSAAAIAAEDSATVEDAFAGCLATNQPALISVILDAQSQEAFEGAMKQALEICPTATEKLSMGKLCLIGDGYTRLTDLDRDTNKRIKRLPGYDTLRIVLAQKAILVEGPSDELIVKKLFKDVHDKLPEEMGIEVIVVSGLGFKNYLNIAKIIGTRTLVIRDNDGDYQTNVENWFKDYQDSAHLTVSAPTDNQLNSLEPALIHENGDTVDNLDSFATAALSAQKKNEFDQIVDLEGKKEFLRELFKDDGAKKVDSAIRIFDSGANSITYPAYIREALTLAE